MSLPPARRACGRAVDRRGTTLQPPMIVLDVGRSGQKRLKNAKVLVIGAGGLGSPALLYLAAAGVGTLGVVDFDEVASRTCSGAGIHGQSDIGKRKAVSARSRSPRSTRS